MIKKGEDKYDLIVGQRRFLAYQKLGWDSIPAIVRDGPDDRGMGESGYGGEVYQEREVREELEAV